MSIFLKGVLVVESDLDAHTVHLRWVVDGEIVGELGPVIPPGMGGTLYGDAFVVARPDGSTALLYTSGGGFGDPNRLTMAEVTYVGDGVLALGTPVSDLGQVRGYATGRTCIWVNVDDDQAYKILSLADLSVVASGAMPAPPGGTFYFLTPFMVGDLAFFGASLVSGSRIDAYDLSAGTLNPLVYAAPSGGWIYGYADSGTADQAFPTLNRDYQFNGNVHNDVGLFFVSPFRTEDSSFAWYVNPYLTLFDEFGNVTKVLVEYPSVTDPLGQLGQDLFTRGSIEPLDGGGYRLRWTGLWVSDPSNPTTTVHQWGGEAEIPALSGFQLLDSAQTVYEAPVPITSNYAYETGADRSLATAHGVAPLDAGSFDVVLWDAYGADWFATIPPLLFVGTVSTPETTFGVFDADPPSQPNAHHGVTVAKIVADGSVPIAVKFKGLGVTVDTDTSPFYPVPIERKTVSFQCQLGSETALYAQPLVDWGVVDATQPENTLILGTQAAGPPYAFGGSAAWTQVDFTVTGIPDGATVWRPRLEITVSDPSAPPVDTLISLQPNFLEVADTAHQSAAMVPGTRIGTVITSDGSLLHDGSDDTYAEQWLSQRSGVDDGPVILASYDPDPRIVDMATLSNFFRMRYMIMNANGATTKHFVVYVNDRSTATLVGTIEHVSGTYYNDAPATDTIYDWGDGQWVYHLDVESLESAAVNGINITIRREILSGDVDGDYGIRVYEMNLLGQSVATTPQVIPDAGTNVYVDCIYVPENGRSVADQPFLDGDQSYGLWEGTPRAATSLLIGSSAPPPNAFDPTVVVPDTLII